VPGKRCKEYGGYLFVLEGIDGAGKTTVCDRVVRLLIEQSFDTVRLREPTSESPWGQEIRARSPKGELSSIEELDLFIRDRDWNVQNRILPSLQEGKVVLMDRYFFATGAYQSGSTGISWDEILRRNREDIGAPEPDIIFILDIPAEDGLNRVIGSRSEKNQQFEQLERLVGVRRAYLEMAHEDSGNYQIIDATRGLDEVVKEVYDIILRYLKASV
jgi:dTMP kinase